MIKHDFFIGNNRVRAESYSCLGIAYHMIGDKTGAEESFRKSVSHDRNQEEFVQLMLNDILDETFFSTS